MPDDPDIAADPFLQLLTEALRAGPGSPEWHQAVTKLRRDGLAGGDHAMLIAVREHLANGKDYRTVRAGPGFTRRLMEQLDEEPAGARRSLPIATLLAFVGAVAMAMFTIGLVVMLLRGGAPNAAAEAAQLRGEAFAQTVAVASFDGNFPPGWRGDLKLLDAQAGLRPATTRPAENVTAQVLVDIPMPADGSAAFETLVRVPSDPNTILQLFVTTDTLVDGKRAPELAWVLQDGNARVVLPSGQFAAQPVAFPTAREGALVRIVVGPTSAVVWSGGRELFAGAHGLPPGQDRHFGIRFVTKGGAASEPSVLSARVLKP
jgi:hypothetical protein